MCLAFSCGTTIIGSLTQTQDSISVSHTVVVDLSEIRSPCSLDHLGIAGALKDSSFVSLSCHQALLSSHCVQSSEVQVGTQAAHPKASVPVQKGLRLLVTVEAGLMCAVH